MLTAALIILYFPTACFLIAIGEEVGPVVRKCLRQNSSRKWRGRVAAANHKPGLGD